MSAKSAACQCRMRIRNMRWQLGLSGTPSAEAGVKIPKASVPYIGAHNREKMERKHPDYLASVEKYNEYIQDFLKGIDGYGIRYYTTGTQKDGGLFEGASG